MNALTIIQRVRASGGEIRLGEDGIKLRISASLRDGLVEEVRAHKATITSLLKSEAGEPWNAEDYRVLFEERAAIQEYDQGLPRSEAETQALEACVVEWLDQNLEPSNPGSCAWCGERETESARVVPFGVRTHTWLHPECWAPWQHSRREQARRRLEECGLRIECADQQSDG